MQALYFCVPFREQLLDYYANNKSIGDVEENLLTCLADLFSQVNISMYFVCVCVCVCVCEREREREREREGGLCTRFQ